MNRRDIQDIIDNLNLRFKHQPNSRCASDDEVRMAMLISHITDLEKIIAEVFEWANDAWEKDTISYITIGHILDLTEPKPMDPPKPVTNCPICGGDIVGDGVTIVRHCENADIPQDVEPDADIIFCKPPELTITTFEEYPPPRPGEKLVPICEEDIPNLKNAENRLMATLTPDYEALEIFTIRHIISEYNNK